jgi:hypothetical protein
VAIPGSAPISGRWLSVDQVDQVTSQWFAGTRETRAGFQRDLDAEKEVLDAAKSAAGSIPEWAERLRAAMPDWGFEICAYRWLDGLDEVLGMIEQAEYHPTRLGRCGDIPTTVFLAAEQRAQAVERWLNAGPQQGQDELTCQIDAWLGRPTVDKQDAARCFIEVVRSSLFEPEEQAKATAWQWREGKDRSEILTRLFYGDGIDGGLQNACGCQTINRLDTYLRVIGGDDSQLAETRWVCNTALRFALRDDPSRLPTTLSYMWGLHAYVAGLDAQWLWQTRPQVAGAAIHVLRRLSRSSAPPPVTRWLAAWLLATTRFWYRRALSFVAEDEIPVHLKDVPELPAIS